MVTRQLTKEMNNALIILRGEWALQRARGAQGLMDFLLVFSDNLGNLERAAKCPRSLTHCSPTC